MSQRLANVILWLFDLLVLLGVCWCARDYMRVTDALANGAPAIPFDSGIYYLLLPTVLWVLTVVQIVVLKRGGTKAPSSVFPVIIAWFIGTLVLANALPRWLASDLTAAGYHAIDDTREIARVSRGASLIYLKDE